MATSIASTNFDYSSLNPTQSTSSTATGNSATEIQNRFLIVDRGDEIRLKYKKH